ncbi:choice-of-anchor Q domain-containing protein [Marinifilum sp.]|uniref:choice-of-anchor Q domain-containing protein n=1 Tax=Marinifilum sp. TaxID=2033137 RepID=UPI003BAD2741
MRNLFYCVCSIILIIGFVACNKEEGWNTDTDFRLSFSMDTLSFDTLFTGFGSTTMQFKVYNKSSKKAQLQDVYLQNSNSAFRINVNGAIGNDFTDFEIGASDSLFVFVEVELKPNNSDDAVLLEDILVFNVNNKLQGVVLNAWAQDVVLVDNDITNSQNWTGNRPYLINNQISVAENVSLALDEGTKVYFRKNAGLDVYGNIIVNGSFLNPVYLGSSRLEELYDNVPGQWNGIHIHESSKNNSLSHFTIQDGINGITYHGNAAEVELEYGILRNFTQNGIATTNVSVKAHDLLIANCGDECLKVDGGNLELFHSTLYNSWSFDVRTVPLIQVLNSSNHNVNIGNCIVWGSQANELWIDDAMSTTIENTLLKLSVSLKEEFTTTFTDCIFNENPVFKSEEDFDFNLSTTSPCIDAGKKSIAEMFSLDLQNSNRNMDDAPDLGVYEFKEAEE